MIAFSVRDAIGDLAGVDFGMPREVELRGLQGTHNLSTARASG
jgi:hypothetical protein